VLASVTVPDIVARAGSLAMFNRLEFGSSQRLPAAVWDAEDSHVAKKSNHGRLRYLRKAPLIAHRLLTDPVEGWLRLREKFMARREQRWSPCSYDVDAEWEQRLHELLGVPWPCPAISEFWALWPAVIESLKAKWLGVGVGFFGGWNDGEPEMVRGVVFDASPATHQGRRDGRCPRGDLAFHSRSA
jgi:hypothetical protein